MASIAPELSSITATVGSVRERIGGLVIGLGPGAEDIAAALYEAERSLLAAARHLERAGRMSA